VWGVLYDLNDLLFFLTILVHSQGPSEQKPIKNYVKKGAWAYPWTAQFFCGTGTPIIIAGTGKATNFKFGRYIHMVHWNKSPLKFGRKGSVGVSRDCPNFLSTPYYIRNG